MYQVVINFSFNLFKYTMFEVFAAIATIAFYYKLWNVYTNKKK